MTVLFVASWCLTSLSRWTLRGSALTPCIHLSVGPVATEQGACISRISEATPASPVTLSMRCPAYAQSRPGSRQHTLLHNWARQMFRIEQVAPPHAVPSSIQAVRRRPFHNALQTPAGVPQGYPPQKSKRPSLPNQCYRSLFLPFCTLQFSILNLQYFFSLPPSSPPPVSSQSASHRALPPAQQTS